jgi:diaminohydroxyphosphoribosylaminopyrimidine deaminase/5-amino-6-(5-phosphoribosylamino)uracil reductase
MTFSDNDHKMMQLALLEARTLTNRVSPNPRVGAVIAKNGILISKGSHLVFGGPHAEVNAIANAKENIQGADLYVTLEPCSHHGKTPPCTDAIIKSGIKKVIFAMKDPNPLVKENNSAKILTEAGIQVNFGLLEKEAAQLNQPFLKGMLTKTPYLIAKWAMSIDGKINTSSGESKWITNESSREISHQLRAEYDAVAIGKNTLEKDNPELNCRYGIVTTSPFRLLFLAEIKKEYFDLKIFKNEDAKTVIVLKNKPQPKIAEEIQNRKIQVIFQNENIEITLKSIYLLGISSILIEGGSELLGSFFDNNQIDYCHCFIAPMIIGGTGLSPIKGVGISKIANAWQLKTMKINQLGDNFHLHGALKLYGYEE